MALGERLDPHPGSSEACGEAGLVCPVSVLVPTAGHCPTLGADRASSVTPSFLWGCLPEDLLSGRTGQGGEQGASPSAKQVGAAFCLGTGSSCDAGSLLSRSGKAGGRLPH